VSTSDRFRGSLFIATRIPSLRNAYHCVFTLEVSKINSRECEFYPSLPLSPEFFDLIASIFINLVTPDNFSR